MVAINIDNVPIDISLDDDAAIDKYLDYSDLDAKLQSRLDSEFETIITVDGAPIVGFDKRERLVNVVCKLFAKEDIRIKEDGIFMPFEEDANGHSMSQGFLFVDCETPADAEKAIQLIHMHKFDKLHTFQVNRFLDIEKYSHVPEEWNESKVVGVGQENADPGFLRDWLMDAAARDQLAMLNQNVTSILWHNPGNPPDTVCRRPHWTDMYFAFSPRGSYFATLHPQGVAVFGGDKMVRMHRFHHPAVSHIDFSPNETYLVTYSPVPLPRPTAQETAWGIESVGHQIIIWCVRTGKLMRSFPLPADAKKTLAWPYFKWSSDEQLFATIVDNQKLSVFETPSFGLLDKKSIPIPGITEFEWMPQPQDSAQFRLDLSAPQKKGKGGSASATATASEKAGGATAAPPMPTHCIAYFVPDRGADQPSQLVLYDVRKREKVRQKQVFYARAAKIHFHAAGDYVLFRLDRSKAVGKAVTVALEIFRLREKGVPCDTLEIKGTLLGMAWEPVGNGLAVLTTLDPIGPQHPPMDTGLLFIYTMERASAASMHAGGLKLVKMLERPKVILNTLSWSPKGRFLVIGGLNIPTSVLEFFDTQAPIEKKKTVTEVGGQAITTESEATPVKFIGRCSTILGNYVSWDPTGRYVLLASTVVAKNQDTCFLITDLQGRIIYRHSAELLRQIQWRPRPPTLLSLEKLNQIASKLKSYAKEFDAMDASATAETSTQHTQRKNKLFEEWLLFASKGLLAVPAVDEVKTYY